MIGFVRTMAQNIDYGSSFQTGRHATPGRHGLVYGEARVLAKIDKKPNEVKITQPGEILIISGLRHLLAQDQQKILLDDS